MPAYADSFPGAVRRSWRSWRRVSGVLGRFLESRRFPIVETDSSAARMPWPGRQRCCAVDISSVLEGRFRIVGWGRGLEGGRRIWDLCLGVMMVSDQCIYRWMMRCWRLGRGHLAWCGWMYYIQNAHACDSPIQPVTFCPTNSEMSHVCVP